MRRRFLQETGHPDLVWNLPRAGAITALLAIGFACGIVVSLLALCVKAIRARRASRPTSTSDSSLALRPAAPSTELDAAPRSASKRGIFSRGLPPLAPMGPLGAGVAATMAAASPVRRSTPAGRGSRPALIPAVFAAGEGQVLPSGRRTREDSLRASSPAVLRRSPSAAAGDLSRGVSIGPLGLDRFLSCMSEADDEYLRSPSAPPAPEAEEAKGEGEGAGGEGGNPFATTEEAVAAHNQALLELEAAKLGLTLVKKKEGGAAAGESGAGQREGGGGQGPRSLAQELEEAGAGASPGPDDCAAQQQ